MGNLWGVDSVRLEACLARCVHSSLAQQFCLLDANQGSRCVQDTNLVLFECLLVFRGWPISHPDLLVEGLSIVVAFQ